MGRVPRFEDGIDRTRRHERQIHQLRSRPVRHSETRTWVVGGSIAGLPTIPGVHISVAPADGIEDGVHPGCVVENRRLVEFGGHVGSGTATIDWYLDGVTIATGHVIDDSPPNTVVLDPPIELTDGQILQPVLVSGIGADLSASFVTTVAPG